AVRVEVNRGVKKCREVLHLVNGQIERRHALVRASVSQKRREFLAALVALHDLGSRQVGTAGAAPRIRPMTEPALIHEQLATAIPGGGIELRVDSRQCGATGRLLTRESGNRYGQDSCDEEKGSHGDTFITHALPRRKGGMEGRH